MELEGTVKRLAGIYKRITKSPPHPAWKLQKQTEPPTFGHAELVSPVVLKKEVERRREGCLEILAEAKKYCDFTDGKISLIVLSCRRWRTLRPLIESMKGYFGGIEKYGAIEKILVDNGSGRGLLENVEKTGFFDKIIAHPRNLGLLEALKDAYRKAGGEYIIIIEDDFILDYKKPFIDKCLGIFREYPEMGIIRLKNQNNWWKPHRVIAPIRETAGGTQFWTWLPSEDGMLNVWCAGSAMFRKVSYFSAGELPGVEKNLSRSSKFHQGYIYECIYAKNYNNYWLAGKVKDCYPFFQPNINKESAGWGK